MSARRPADFARRSAKALAGRDAFRRETFVLSREAAREKAREMFRRFRFGVVSDEVAELGGKSTVGRTARFGFPYEWRFPHSARSGQLKRVTSRLTALGPVFSYPSFARERIRIKRSGLSRNPP